MTKELTEEEAVAKAVLEAVTGFMRPETAVAIATAAIEAHKAHLSASGCVIVKSDVIEKATHDLVRERLAWSDAIASRLGSALSDKEG